MGYGDLMPAPEPQEIRLYCNVCGKESEHWRDLFKHWTEEHSKEYEEGKEVMDKHTPRYNQSDRYSHQIFVALGSGPRALLNRIFRRKKIERRQGNAENHGERDQGATR